jgi:hypothetical protein
MLSVMASMLLAVLSGIVGWFATSFIAKPLADFWNLKSQVLEEMVFTGNINDEHMASYKASAASLRRLGAKVQATEVTTSWLLRWYLSIFKYDLSIAGKNLIGLSNALNVPGRALHADKIERGLRLPRTSTDEELEAIKQEISHPHR